MKTHSTVPCRLEPCRADTVSWKGIKSFYPKRNGLLYPAASDFCCLKYMTFSRRPSGMVQLLMTATLVISRFASPVFPLPSSHLADSRMHLKMTKRRLLVTFDLISEYHRLIKIKTKNKTPPYIDSNHSM